MSRKKIALVGFRLSGGGGGKVMANLSNYFADKNLDVHIIIFHDELGYDYSGKLFNLGKLKSKSNTIFNKIKRFYHLKKYIKQHKFDYIIDFRFRINVLQEVLIAKWIYKTKTIYTVHSSHLETFLPKSNRLANIIYGKCYKVVSISNEMTNLIEDKYNFKNLTTIYNPIDAAKTRLYAQEKIEIKFDYILAVGEFNTNIKQFDKLIEAYSKSVLPKRNIALVILGKGKLKLQLQLVIKTFNVQEHVHLLGFKNNPYKYMKSAKFVIQSSSFEGLPMVLIEALSCDTPVIAFDCLTGPSEIIQNEENGLLVENQNFEKLTQAMNIFVSDSKLYRNCKSNAKNSVKNFSVDNIGKEWLNLMNIS